MKLHLRKRLRNSIAAFHTGETNYHLEVGSFEGFAVAFRSGTADEKVIAHSFGNDIFFTGSAEISPDDGEVIIDIGAHIGTFSLLAASIAPSGKVHAIEASQETFNYLHVNALMNPRLNIVPHRLAITDKEGSVTLHHDRGNWGHSIMKPLSARGESVPAMSLSKFMAENGIGNVGLIKFNCEGAEFPILMTTPLDVLARVRKMLVLYHLDLAENYALAPLLERLQQAGFRCEIKNQRKQRGWIVALR